MTVELLRGYRVRSDSEESSVYNFAESELIIPDIPLKLPNRTDIVVRKIKIDFLDVHIDGGFNVQVRYSGANERNYNFLCAWTSDNSWETNFGYKIDRDSALRIINEYHRFMDNMICLESISVEDMKAQHEQRLASIRGAIEERNRNRQETTTTTNATHSITVDYATGRITHSNLEDCFFATPRATNNTSEWSVVEEAEDDYYRHVSQTLGYGHRETSLGNLSTIRNRLRQSTGWF